MKNAVVVIFTIIIILFVILGCAMWYINATKVDETVNTTQMLAENNSVESINDAETTEQENLSEPIFTNDNYPRVDASLAIHPLVDSIAANFLGVEKDSLNFEYTKTRTSDVYKRLIDGNVDVAFVAEPAKQDLDYAKEKGVELDIIPVTSSAFVFIVNSENPIENLTLDEVVRIYKGDILNWNEVGGEDLEIIPYQRPNGSGSQTAMISLVMKDESLMAAPNMHIEGEMGGMINAVAEYDNSRASIGYSYFYYVNTMYKRDTIKMLEINGVRPTIETIKDGTYPLYTNGFIAIRKSSGEDTPERKWLKAVQSERGSKIIEDAGYVPIG